MAKSSMTFSGCDISSTKCNGLEAESCFERVKRKRREIHHPLEARDLARFRALNYMCAESNTELVSEKILLLSQVNAGELPSTKGRARNFCMDHLLPHSLFTIANVKTFALDTYVRIMYTLCARYEYKYTAHIEREPRVYGVRSQWGYKQRERGDTGVAEAWYEPRALIRAGQISHTNSLTSIHTDTFRHRQKDSKVYVKILWKSW